MARVNLTRERKSCREFYEKWGFVQRVVALYAEGVSWKGCKVVAPSAPGKIPRRYRQIIDIEAVKHGVRGMLVDGVGNFNLEVSPSLPALSVSMPAESAEEKAGRSFLSLAVHNARSLEEMVERTPASPAAVKMTGIVVDGICEDLGIPFWLLLPEASAAAAYDVIWALSAFRGLVEELRNYIALQIGEAMQPVISDATGYRGKIELVWNEDWLPTERVAEYGPLYQVFKAQGIELKSLAENMIGQAKLLFDIRALSRYKYQKLIKLFL